ncbi:hypothetical protein ABLE91_11175 [Aquabacter sp. CN5-332]|uniref:hypothetical protein n=1 Tax=Aquabacter sp. CN5-332 TaxID=3156608 RepID=UPI0032B41BB1
MAKGAAAKRERIQAMIAVCHALAKAARRACRSAALLALLGLAVVALRPEVARAQSSSNVPGQGTVDPEIDPFPYDPRLEIRTYLRNHLPSLWWANEPEYGLGVFSVTIHVPVNWRGNPTSALMQICPQADSTVWNGIQRLELKPFYKNATWPGVVCRP